MTQRVHRNQRRIAREIANVVLEDTAREFRTTLRFNRHNARLLTLAEILTQEGEGNTAKVTTTTDAANHHIGLGVGHLHLQDRLLARDGLVQEDMVHHTTQAIARAFGIFQGTLHGLRDRQAQASGRMGIGHAGCTSRRGEVSG